MTGKTSPSLRVALGGDHAGFPLKQLLADTLRTGLLFAASGAPPVAQLKSLVDCGTDDEASTDYPDFAAAVGRELIAGRADRGILVCGSGVGVSVAANKIAGIRAAVCHDTYTAHQGVEHDDMNVLCIGARVIGSELAMEIVRSFLLARYEPAERHARRLEKFLRLEREGLPPQA